jgi:hypothetical protein
MQANKTVVVNDVVKEAAAERVNVALFMREDDEEDVDQYAAAGVEVSTRQVVWDVENGEGKVVTVLQTEKSLAELGQGTDDVTMSSDLEFALDNPDTSQLHQELQPKGDRKGKLGIV